MEKVQVKKSLHTANFRVCTLSSRSVRCTRVCECNLTRKSAEHYIIKQRASEAGNSIRIKFLQSHLSCAMNEKEALETKLYEETLAQHNDPLGQYVYAPCETFASSNWNQSNNASNEQVSDEIRQYFFNNHQYFLIEEDQIVFYCQSSFSVEHFNDVERNSNKSA